VLINEKCKQFPPLTPSETATLKALFQRGASVTPEENGIRTQLFDRADSYNQCSSRENYALHFATYKRWSDEFTASKRAAHPRTTDDFDAKGLSAEVMAKKGKADYDAENYVAAMRWFQKAADLGNGTQLDLWQWASRSAGRYRSIALAENVCGARQFGCHVVGRH
jgi:hypothetical protein